MVSGKVTDLLKHELDHRCLSGRPRSIPVPAIRRPTARARRLTVVGTRAQPAGRHGQLPARLLRRSHRGQRFGEIHADQRHPLQRAGQTPVFGPDSARPAPAGGGRRPGRQNRRRGPVTDRPYSAEQSGDIHRRLRQHPQALRGYSEPRSAVTNRAGSPSTSRAADVGAAPATARSRSR